MLKRLTTVDYLQQVKDFWTVDRVTRGAYARDANGATCPYSSADATCFCFVGAIDRAVGDEHRTEVIDSLMKVIEVDGGGGSTWYKENGASYLSCWYERMDTTHSDAIDLIDKAIAAELVV